MHELFNEQNAFAVKPLNDPKNVALASDKLKFFTHLEKVGEGVPVRYPSFTKDKEAAKIWAKGGAVVICRTVLNGHSGAGIVVANSEEEVVDAPLYTLYVPKKEEYRVHVFNKKMIHSSRKARKKDVPDEDVD